MNQLNNLTDFFRTAIEANDLIANYSLSFFDWPTPIDWASFRVVFSHKPFSFGLHLSAFVPLFSNSFPFPVQKVQHRAPEPKFLKISFRLATLLLSNSRITWVVVRNLTKRWYTSWFKEDPLKSFFCLGREESNLFQHRTFSSPVQYDRVLPVEFVRIRMRSKTLCRGSSRRRGTWTEGRGWV